MPVQEAKTRNEKEQGAIEAGEKLARELGLNVNLGAPEADELALDPRIAASSEALVEKTVVSTQSESMSFSESSPSVSPSMDVRTESIDRLPSKDVSSHAVLDLAADASSAAAT